MQKPLVGPLDLRRHMNTEMRKAWTHHSAGRLSVQRGRALTTMQAKAKGRQKESDDSESLHFETSHEHRCMAQRSRTGLVYAHCEYSPMQKLNRWMARMECRL